MPVKWGIAVRDWNDTQDFKKDYYAIPRKGGRAYGQIMDILHPKPKPEPKPEPTTIIKKVEDVKANKEINSEEFDDAVSDLKTYLESYRKKPELGTNHIKKTYERIVDESKKVKMNKSELKKYLLSDVWDSSTFKKMYDILEKEKESSVATEPKPEPKVEYHTYDYKNNLEKAKDVLLDYKHPTSIEEKKRAIKVLVDLTHKKENKEGIQETVKPYAREAARVLQSIKDKPHYPIGLAATSPGSGKPHYDTYHDLREVVKHIPDVSQTLVKEALEQEKQTKKAQDKQFKIEQEKSKIEQEKRNKTDQEVRNSQEAKDFREKYGEASYKGKVFKILDEFNVTDAIDYSKYLEKIQKKYPDFPPKLTQYYTDSFWSKYESYLEDK